MTQEHLATILKNREKYKELNTLYFRLFESGNNFKFNDTQESGLSIIGYYIPSEFLPEPLHVMMGRYKENLIKAISKLEEEFDGL